jgi:hypothetical protein
MKRFHWKWAVVAITALAGFPLVAGLTLQARFGATTGDEAFCIPGSELAQAKQTANRSWDAARRLIMHYEMCEGDYPLGKDRAKVDALYRIWIVRGNSDAMRDFATGALSSWDPATRRNGESILRTAARLGNPVAVADVQREMFDVAAADVLGERPTEPLLLPLDVPTNSNGSMPTAYKSCARHRQRTNETSAAACSGWWFERCRDAPSPATCRRRM